MTVDIVTFGCRLNAVDGETIRAHARRGGARNLVVVNSCAVTAEATRQARQAVRRTARERPGAEIVVTGCGAQVELERFAAMPEVSRVVGSAEKVLAETWAYPPPPCGEASRVGVAPSKALRSTSGLPPHSEPPPTPTLPRKGGGGRPRIEVGDVFAARDVSAPPADAAIQLPRAFVQVQTGCDHRCTFCVIPFGRGAARSTPVDAVIAEVRRVVARGATEAVLTGVDVTSWGQDLGGAPRFGDLVRAVLKAVPELKRLRLSSLDAVEIDDALLRALAEEERLMPHLHLSLQSGDDIILKRMKRRHKRADALRLCDAVRRVRPDVAFGADLIAGFPTETEAMFENTRALLEECGVAYAHVFPYSPRPGTPAARMPQVAGAVVKARAAALRETGERLLERHLEARTGRPLTVLCEGRGVARAADFTTVHVAPELPKGAFVDVEAARHDGRALIAA